MISRHSQIGAGKISCVDSSYIMHILARNDDAGDAINEEGDLNGQ